MRAFSRILLIGGMLMGIMALPLSADYLINTDLSQGLSGWHGDGEQVFLKPDGLESSQGDPDVIAVIKLRLSRSESRSVYQEFETPGKPQNLHFKVDIFPSSDFHRSSSDSDYTPQVIDYPPGTFTVWGVLAIFRVDFWIRATPTWHYKLANTIPGRWVTVDYSFTNTPSDSSHQTVYFCVPPGQGAIYLKNPVAQ